MKKIGFLHTSPVHIATFDRLLEASLTDHELVHLVDEPLLAQAMVTGIDADVQDQVDAHIQKLADAGCTQIVCTCSTIGGLVEEMSLENVSISRIDRPMAAAAVENGHVVLVVVAIGSTLIPTRELLLDESRRQERPILIQELVLDHAWPIFLAGDLDRYYQALADGIRAQVIGNEWCQTKLPPEVVVIAQASMANAADLLQDIGIPVLTSPQLCANSLLNF